MTHIKLPPCAAETETNGAFRQPSSINKVKNFKSQSVGTSPLIVCQVLNAGDELKLFFFFFFFNQCVIQHLDIKTCMVFPTIMCLSE